MNFRMLFLLIIFLFSGPNSMTQDLEAEISSIENGLIPPIVVKGDEITALSLEDRMKFHKVPGVSIAVIKDGKIHWVKAYGMANTQTGKEVDIHTLFQAGSISKPIAALAALKLVQDVHGFPGYMQTDSFPSDEAVLNGKGNTDTILANINPGSMWRYSGGGYTVIEQVVQDVSGISFENYLEDNILSSIGMERSTYAQPLPKKYHQNASAAYDSDGKIIDGLWHNYPEQAAAGLWTTPMDLAKYIIEIQDIYMGKKNGVLSVELVNQMFIKDKNSWGLGPSLRGDGDSLLFGHGGKNAGFTNNMQAFVKKGNGIVIMTNADSGGKLIGEIMRSVSNYYNWNISNPEKIEPVTLSNAELSRMTGKYMMNVQVPDIGDYIINVKIENNYLVVIDPNSGDHHDLIPVSKTEFVEVNSCDRIEYKKDEKTNKAYFLWNKRFHFDKIQD